MGAVLSLLLILAVSILITRIATVALTHTGMSREMARFQARSAFTGVGFTTEESEGIVRHPVRRRIVMMLMLLGNVGIVSVLASIVLSVIAPGDDPQWWGRTGLFVVGVLSLLWFASSRWVDRWLSKLISRALMRWTDLQVRDYASLLRLSGKYAVTELQVQADDWMAEHDLSELQLRDEGVIVLGIHRKDGSYIGAPNGETKLHAGDVALLYGLEEHLCDLDERRRDLEGQRAHAQAVQQHEARLREQAEAERSEEQDSALDAAGGADSRASADRATIGAPPAK